MGHRGTIDGRRTVSLGFTRLLARLDGNPDRAAAEYERLRVTLQKYFDWHCAWPPEECVDETLDRLVLKLGTDTPVEDVRAYARGVARLVLLEWRRRPVPVSIDEHREQAGRSGTWVAEESEVEALPACLERCLAALPDESRTLVLEYYVAERRAKIEHRRRLARALGLSESALRNRVQRVRDRLERCVHTCTSEGGARGLERAVKPRVVESDIP
jgi:DNA-directed RNA polymerase specialized sigma24 family protein